MTRLHHWLVALPAGLVLGATPALAQCRAADSTSTVMITRWRSLMVDTNGSVRLALQRNFIAQVDSSTVVLVTDKNTCSKAMRAYNDVRGAGSQPPSGAVYVIKVGTVYIVRDPVQRNPESGWYGDVVLDSGFRVKSQLLGI